LGLRSVRLPLIVLIVVIPAISWLWIVAMGRDMYGSMTGPSAWMMRPTWDAPHLVLLWAMWAVMMAAMMLPSAYPILAIYAGAARRRPAARPLYLYFLAAGYLGVWAVFSIMATVLQRLLSRWLLLTPMMETSSAKAGGIVLLVAGVYQLTPLKRRCLGACRSPMAFMMERWREGRTGALQMGATHGVHCLGCCWALMLLLFVGGVMNLIVIVALTIFVAVEKLGPFGVQSARVSGALLIAVGAWMLWR
jgi:predicted metal-binding membrane protein